MLGPRPEPGTWVPDRKARNRAIERRYCGGRTRIGQLTVASTFSPLRRAGTNRSPAPLLPAATRRRASLYWARLLARIYEIQPLTCPRCHGPMRLIAFLTKPPTIRAILAHLDEPTTPPPLAPRARAPPEPETAWAGTPDFAFDQSPPWDPTAAAPDASCPFDQTLN